MAGLRMLTLVICAGLASNCPAADERFPFVIPGDDASPSITNMAHLSPKPAGADGFVRIENGHMVTSAGRLRTWGFNICSGANFPEHEDAEKVAAHLAKLGVNGLRIHHHDTPPWPRGILGKPVDGKRSIDPQQIQKQDYFFDQLNQRGIYININLHVGRMFTEEEGFVSKDLPRSVRYNKYVLYYEPRMRELFKQFCREYLGHVNPYRKLKRSDDPAIAMVEITNENSFSTLGSGIAASLPEPYRGEFARQWNAWLKRHYRSTQDLKQAWGGQGEPVGATLVESAAWKTGLGGWRLHQGKDHPVKVLFDQPGPKEGLAAIKLDVSTKSLSASSQELQFPSLTIEPGKVYTMDFWVKADAPRTVHADLSNSGPSNWSSVGWAETLQVSPAWQHVRRVFRSKSDVPGKVRICFKFGMSDVDLHLAGVTLKQGGEPIVLPEGQSLEAANVDIPVTGWSERALADVKRYMEETEEGFCREMVDFLKKDLGVKVPITASQITYHPPAIVANTCDYTDIHAYWQHPHFPRKPWDPRDWTIGNTPMETAPGRDALLGRTPWRLLDRPFTISEWNIADPSDYAASVAPFAAMVAALQDWDGVFFFDYQSNEKTWYTDRLQGYFSFNGSTAKLALFAACANLYRRGDLGPLKDVAAGALADRVSPTLALSHRLGIDPKATAAAKITAPEGNRLASPDGRVVWDATSKEQAYVRVDTPATGALWGLIGGRSFDVGKTRITVGEVEHNYAAIVITSMDGRPIEQSKRLLLTAVGSAQNTGMQWNETRTSIGNKWGTGPAQVNGIAAQVKLPMAVKRVRALDGRGQPQGDVPVQADGQGAKFSIGPEHRTLWYEVEAP